MKTVEDVQILEFGSHSNDDGSLVPLELETHIPFDVKRVFYVYGVPTGETRGLHAHHTTQQLLIVLNGECRVTCRDGTATKEIILSSPTQGVLVPEMIWDEQVYLRKDTILLVFSSTEYNKEDYIENWDTYRRLNSDSGIPG
jgi:dTDP-4-dehydrorhamnose 3,5-epimerase-like enzyme